MAENAKVLVDTSVWIDFLRGNEAAVKNLGSLINNSRVAICGQIRQEVLQGSRDKGAFAKLEEQMSIWDYEAEEADDFVEAARIFSKLRWKGITLPPTDCLIAAVAVRRKLPLYAHDPDFDHITELLRHTP